MRARHAVLRRAGAVNKATTLTHRAFENDVPGEPAACFCYCFWQAIIRLDDWPLGQSKGGGKGRRGRQWKSVLASTSNV